MDRAIQRRLWTRTRSAVLVLTAAGLVSLAFLARGLSTSTLHLDPDRLVISTVEREQFQEFTPVTGQVLPRDVFFLGSVEGGRVEELYAEEGDVVEKGQPILRLANTDLQLEILRREDLLAEQRNQLVDARLEGERQEDEARRRLAELEHEILKQRRIHERDASLNEAGLIPEIDFELSLAEKEFLQEQKELLIRQEENDRRFRQEQLKQVEEAVGRMAENLSLARQKLEKLTVRSPISGRLTSLDAELGESKAPGERIGQVDVLDDFKVRAEADQVYITRVGIGQTALIELDGESYELRVEKTYPEVQGGRFAVDLEFADRLRLPEGIKRGQTLHLRLMLGERAEVLTLDAGPFFQKTGGRWAYVVEPGGAFATRRPIILGRRTTDAYEVLDGLEPGDRVVTSSYDTLGEYERLVFEE
jgi:HlyD family secretion protein